LPRFFATMGLSDSRQGRFAGYVFPPNVARFRSPPCRASQAPRLICPRALSPTTPEGPMTASACCFILGLLWLHPCRRTGHLRFPIEAESGSLALRLACSLPQSPAPLLRLTPVRLHAEQAIYMMNSFQFTRSARPGKPTVMEWSVNLSQRLKRSRPLTAPLLSRLRMWLCALT
jgi:hypothetical protein